jgi:hypothetical protein
MSVQIIILKDEEDGTDVTMETRGDATIVRDSRFPDLECHIPTRKLREGVSFVLDRMTTEYVSDWHYVDADRYAMFSIYIHVEDRGLDHVTNKPHDFKIDTHLTVCRVQADQTFKNLIKLK